MTPQIKPSKAQPSNTFNKFSPTRPEEKNIGISFRYLKEGNGKFEYKKQNEGYFQELIDKIKAFCGYTRKQLESDLRLKDQWRYHEIEFGSPRITESHFGINILRNDVYEDARQFQLTSNEHGRVHGFWIENIFYVVWLDPKHELCPDRK
jgi:hypothetical protein